MLSCDVLIVGAGPVGLFAAFQAGILGMSVCLIDSLDRAGGQCIELYPHKPIYDIPASPRILAKDLVARLVDQASPFNPQYIFKCTAIRYKVTSDGNFIVDANIPQGTHQISAKVILIAAGNGSFVPNKPMIQNIEQYDGRYVFYSVQDPTIFYNKNVAIAGGGDSAVDWAIELSEFARHVFVIHRRAKFRCLPQSFDKLQSLPSSKVSILTPYQVQSIIGKANIELLELEAMEDGFEPKSIPADYLLAFFGLKMDLGPIKSWGLNLMGGHISVDQTTMQTNIDGIYAIGDIATYTHKLKLILSGFAEAATALHHAYQKIFNKSLKFEYSTNKQM